MNIDSALRMIDNEISNFGGEIKMQAGLMLPGAWRGDSTRRGGRWGGWPSWWPKIAVMMGDVQRVLITIVCRQWEHWGLLALAVDFLLP